MENQIQPDLLGIYVNSIVENINKQCDKNTWYTLVDLSIDNNDVLNITLNENKALEHFHFTMTILKQSDVLTE